jgi:hypothetical protein
LQQINIFGRQDAVQEGVQEQIALGLGIILHRQGFEDGVAGREVGERFGIGWEDAVVQWQGVGLGGERKSDPLPEDPWPFPPQTSFFDNS